MQNFHVTFASSDVLLWKAFLKCGHHISGKVRHAQSALDYLQVA